MLDPPVTTFGGRDLLPAAFFLMQKHFGERHLQRLRPGSPARKQGIGMKVTIVGSGDAWGSGGRFHTCFRVDLAGRCILADFGASAPVGWKRLDLDLAEVDAIVLSHLHGDHFGGVPFLLLESQFELKRTRPLEIIGPPGTKARLDTLIEAFFPRIVGRNWRFDWSVRELEPGTPADLLGLRLNTVQVVHSQGAIDTGLRLSDGQRTFAYSGDTQWTEALTGLADGADLFICECYGWEPGIPGHIAWSELAANLPRLKAGKIALTHMGRTVLPHVDEIESHGPAACFDGHVFDF